MIGLTVALLLGVGLYVLWQRAHPYIRGSQCEVEGSERNEPLELDQAANAATISGVAYRKSLPERAVVIAYATAMQESDIRNLPGGDRDSVGIFQQRPSQGWGRVEQLRDPIYATGKFYDALVKVERYTERELHDAAQRVQRSADGTAYAPHETRAQRLAEAYTGRRPKAVWCWYPPDERTAPRRDEAIRILRKTFGTGKLRVTGDSVKVSGTRTGWAVAYWAVSHAQEYGLSEVRFAGLRWRADKGPDGWTEYEKAPADRVSVLS